jgi:hypothetical protein
MNYYGWKDIIDALLGSLLDPLEGLNMLKCGRS